MKQLLIITAIWLLFFLPVQAQENPKKCPHTPPSKAPALVIPDLFAVQLAVEVAQSELVAFEKRLKHLDDIDYYKRWEAYDTVKQKPIAIKDLDDKQIRGFFLYQAEKLHNNMLFSMDMWRQCSEKFKKAKFKDDDPHKEKREEAYKKASASFVSLTTEARKLHMKLAKKREQMTASMMEAYAEKDKQLAEELRGYLKDVQKEHDTLRLIDRTQGE